MLRLEMASEHVRSLLKSDAFRSWDAERRNLLDALKANRKRRDRAAAEINAAREELQSLLVAGSTLYAFGVTALAHEAGVSRDTAHRLIRESPIPSRNEQHQLASEAGIPGGPDRLAWFQEQGWR